MFNNLFIYNSCILKKKLYAIVNILILSMMYMFCILLLILKHTCLFEANRKSNAFNHYTTTASKSVSHQILWAQIMIMNNINT